MAIRFYIAPQQGTGTSQDPFRSILNDFITVGYSTGKITAQNTINIIQGIGTAWIQNPIISACTGFSFIHWSWDDGGVKKYFKANIVSIDSDTQLVIDRLPPAVTNVPYSISLESFQEIDHPARRISICCVTAADATHSTIAADSRVIVVSRLYPTKLEAVDGLQEALNNIPGAADLKAKLEANGISTTWITGSNSVKDAIRYIFRKFFLAQIVTGQHKDASMADIIIRNLDTKVASIPPAIRTGVSNWMQSKGLAVGWINSQTVVREILHFIIENLGFGFIHMMGEEF